MINLIKVFYHLIALPFTLIPGEHLELLLFHVMFTVVSVRLDVWGGGWPTGRTFDTPALKDVRRQCRPYKHTGAHM